MSASNISLYILDHPEFDPDWKTSIPRLIKWTEDYFVFRCAPANRRPSGAPISWVNRMVSWSRWTIRQHDMPRSAHRWYALSGDEAYKEKAYRSLNWVTYCNNSEGQAFESPVSKNVSNWWSDCYGECPRMFYHAFAAFPNGLRPERTTFCIRRVYSRMFHMLRRKYSTPRQTRQGRRAFDWHFAQPASL